MTDKTITSTLRIDLMRKYSFALVFAATWIIGCNRGTEVASVDETASGAAVDAVVATTEHTPGAFYSVDDYDPARDANADLAATVERAKVDNKRIILEVGGRW